MERLSGAGTPDPGRKEASEQDTDDLNQGLPAESVEV
jgi:hypothetical protein